MPPTPNRWLVLAVLATSLLVIALDATVLNIALPTLAADLEPSGTELLWIVDAYGLVLAGLLVAMAGLGDRIGRRRLLTAGLLVFAAAAGLAALARSPEQLIAARVLLGAGGAMIMPSTLSVLRNVFLDDRERAVAVGVWSAVAAGGFAVGPIVGGAILAIAPSWSWVFALQVPVVLAALVAVRALVPESRNPEPGPWDPTGITLSVAGMVALVWGIKEAAKHGTAEPAGFVAIATGAMLLTGFVRRQAHLARPLVDVRLFRDRRFAMSALAVLFTFFALGGLLLLLTQYLQIIEGHGPLEAGLRLLPLAAAAAVGAPLADSIVRRAGAHVAVGGGFAAVAVALAALSGVQPDTPYPLVAAALATIGAGAGIASTAASAAILAAAPPERAGGAAAVQETAFELGGAVGVAVLGSVMASAYREALGGLPGVPAAVAEAAREGLPMAAEAAAAVGGASGSGLLEAASRAFLDGMEITALAGAAAMALIAIAALTFMPRDRETRGAQRPVASGSAAGRHPATAVPGESAGA